MTTKICDTFGIELPIFAFCHLPAELPLTDWAT